MRRLVILAQYSPTGGLPGHVAVHLRGLRPVADRLVLASNSPLDGEADELCDRVLVRQNRGFDFAAWRDVLATEAVAGFDWVVLTNSSIVGPLYPLAPIMARMEGRGADFWGMVRSEEVRPHLQSVFLAFSRRVTGSSAWRDFWASVEDHDDKQAVIDQYEVKLTGLFERAGFTSDQVVARVPIGRPYVYGIRRMRPRFSWSTNRINKMVFAPNQTLLLGCPYLKASLFWGPSVVVPPTLPRLLFRSFPWEEAGL